MHTLNLSALLLAHDSLAQTLAKLSDTDWLTAQEPIVRDTLMAGAVQKFELVYELSLKMLKRHLEQSAFSPDEWDLTHFRNLLRAGFETGMLDRVEDWFKYREMRNITSHTYDQAKALAIYAELPRFLESSRYLCAQLQSHHANA